MMSVLPTDMGEGRCDTSGDSNACAARVRKRVTLVNTEHCVLLDHQI